MEKYQTYVKPSQRILYRKVASSSTFFDFQKAYEGEIWCLCTVTFDQKVPKLNSRPVYCSRLYGMYYSTKFFHCTVRWQAIYIKLLDLMTTLIFF